MEEEDEIEPRNLCIPAARRRAEGRLVGRRRLIIAAATGVWIPARRAGAAPAASSASGSASSAGSAPAAPSTKAPHRLDVTLSNGAVAGGNDTLKVRQGEAVEIAIASDRPMTLHVHGYELSADVGPEHRATIAFVAALPGRFPVHRHGNGPENHRAVFFVEVHP